MIVNPVLDIEDSFAKPVSYVTPDEQVAGEVSIGGVVYKT